MITKFKDASPQSIIKMQDQLFIKPSLALSQYIAHYTVSFGGYSSADLDIPNTLNLIPDASGCLIFTYDGSTINSVLWGATTKTYTVINDTNTCPMRLFIEFFPGGLFCLTGINQTELTDMQLPLQLINSELHSLIADAFEKAIDLNTLIDMINDILLECMQKNMVPVTVIATKNIMNQNKGCISVKTLSTLQLYSERHLNRLFSNYIGINMKTLSNIIRINHVVSSLVNRKFTLADLAQTAQFYDEAHFIHTFKAICGSTPKKYIASMSDFYNEPFKF